jgi:EmrB/QacA subfamily drug resistance transporter
MNTIKNRKWWGLLAIMPALAMIFVDVSVLPVALPSIQKYLEASSLQLQWCINSYLLVTAILVLAGGKIGDWMGHRKAFSIGMLVFAVSSAMCGLASSAFGLITARAIQGVGAALMTPASTALLMSIFPPNERGKATGISVSASSLFMIIGPLVGGYLTQNFSWRWIFWINLPIALIGLLLVFIFIPRSNSRTLKFDKPGFIYFIVACSSLVILLMEGRSWGLSSSKTVSYLIFFLAGTCLLVSREKKATYPFLDLSLFKHPIFSAVNISIFSTQFIMMITVFRAIFFQDSLDWSPMKTGVVTVLSSCPVLFLSPLGGWLSDKLGPKFPISLGFILMIFSFIWTPIFIDSPMDLLMIGLVAFGCSIPLVLTPSYASAMGAIPPSKAGSAFGTIATIRSLSATLGVAVLGAFIDSLQMKSLTNFAEANPLTKDLSPTLLDKIITGSSNQILDNLPAPQSNLLSTFYQEAQVRSFLISHWTIAAVLVIVFVFVFMLYHRKSKHRLPDAPAEGWD